MESGHLVIVHPETFVDTELTERLTEAMVELISAGAFDDIESRSAFAELSMSRMGLYGDPGLIEMVFDELKRRGLARATADGVSIPLHPVVRRVYLLLSPSSLVKPALGTGSTSPDDQPARCGSLVGQPAADSELGCSAS